MMRCQLLECQTLHENIDDCPIIEGARDISEILAPLPEQPTWTEKRKLSTIQRSCIFVTYTNISHDLAMYCLHTRQSLSTIDDLLYVLRAYHPELPTTGRQLLGTPQSQRENITVQDKGEYGHSSLSETLVSEIKTRTSGPTEELAISLGVDGVSTGHDGCQASWLIATQVIEPFVGDINCVGIWCEQGKPTNFNTFMRTTVDELKV